MKGAQVVVAGLASHPESGRVCLRVTTDCPWASGGDKGQFTDVWCSPAGPPPVSGSQVTWDSHHVWLGGVGYPKLEYDSKG